MRSILPLASSSDALRIELLVALALLHAQAVDDAGYLDFIPGITVFAPAALGRLALDGFGDGNDGGKIANFFGVLVERVAGDEEAQHFLFIGEAHALFPIGDVGQIVAFVAVDGHFIEEAEEAGLAELRVLLRLLGALHGLVDGGKERSRACPASRARRP